jgi:hypothetical protein
MIIDPRSRRMSRAVGVGFKVKYVQLHCFYRYYRNAIDGTSGGHGRCSSLMSLMQDVVTRLFGQSKFKRVSVRRSRNIAAGEMIPVSGYQLRTPTYFYVDKLYSMLLSFIVFAGAIPQCELLASPENDYSKHQCWSRHHC